MVAKSEEKLSSKSRRPRENDRSFISPQEYDIKIAEDIQDALKDQLRGAIKEMVEVEMDDHLGYETSGPNPMIIVSATMKRQSIPAAVPCGSTSCRTARCRQWNRYPCRKNNWLIQSGLFGHF